MTRLYMFVILMVIAAIGSLMVGLPMYSVWQQGLKGKAELARAEANRQILVKEAEAKRDAAALLGEAEVKRAEKLADANKILGASLKGQEEYLRYLWIQSIHDASAQNQIIYVPTEAGLPVLEAGRFFAPSSE